MASYFDYSITLRDSKNLMTTMNFDLGEFSGADIATEYLAARSAATQVRGALVDITTAFVAKERLSLRLSDDNQVPGVGVADITDEAFVLTHLAPPTEARKVHGIRIPAPINAMFLTDGVTVNIVNALLKQYVQQLSQHTLVSDGEKINLNTGADGIDSGYWRSRAKRGK
jgi:hypothetical protein